MKKVAMVSIVLLILIFLTTCPGHSKKNQTIKEINRNCNVPFTLTQSESVLKNISGYSKNQGFGSYSLENDDLSITVGGYPDCLDKYHIIGYQIKSYKYTFMGLQVGCSLDAVDEVMKQNGFIISNDENWRDRYKKNGVRIGISLKDNIVTIFHVSVEVTNKQNVSF
jgi:hypothetical protein